MTVLMVGGGGAPGMGSVMKVGKKQMKKWLGLILLTGGITVAILITCFGHPLFLWIENSLRHGPMRRRSHEGILLAGLILTAVVLSIASTISGYWILKVRNRD